VRLRPVEEADLDVFFEHQSDLDAASLARVPSRERPAFNVHWTRILSDRATLIRTIEVDGPVAGSIGSWDGERGREVTYWLGREHWGRGFATEALREFLEIVDERRDPRCVTAQLVGKDAHGRAHSGLHAEKQFERGRTDVDGVTRLGEATEVGVAHEQFGDSGPCFATSCTHNPDSTASVNFYSPSIFDRTQVFRATVSDL